jgi:uncharacterized protein
VGDRVMEPSIGFGRVAHHRARPVRHRFVYPVFFLRVPLSRLDRLARPGLSVDRFNLFSLRRRDFGPRDGNELEPWIRGLLKAHGLTQADGEVVLQAFPRMLGYAFNPIAFWHCLDRQGRLRAVLCEVNNTFGERHNYLVAHADGRPIEAGDRLVAGKALHVSPFCRVEGHYRFRFAGGEAHPIACVDYHDASGRVIATSISGRTLPLTSARLLGAFLRYPLMTFGIVARIHWQALRLWSRQVPWYPKPSPPLEETSR